MSRLQQASHRKTILILSALICLLFFAIVLSPSEKSLGTHIRLVYLHGVWVWTALAAYLLAAITGLISLILRKASLDQWSLAFGRTGLIFWLTYLPIAMWAMQANWNGLFLSEPRWRMAFVFAIGNTAIQIGLVLVHKLYLPSLLNLLFCVILFLTIQRTPNVMHPASPIYGGKSMQIQIYFTIILMLTLAIGWFVAKLWYTYEN